jgi:hypothetical protein
MAVALVAAGLWACASPPPPTVEPGHPAHPLTAPAPETKLRVLSTYRDFVARPEPRPTDELPVQGSDDGEEGSDAHKH